MKSQFETTIDFILDNFGEDKIKNGKYGEYYARDETLAYATHHGLNELPSLKKIYPYLNFEETIAFAAGSWLMRNNNLDKDNLNLKLKKYSGSSLSPEQVDNSSIYEIFNEVNGFIFPNLRKSKKISVKNKQREENLNLFKKDLEFRLEQVPEDIKKELKEELKDQVITYVFDCNYRKTKRNRKSGNYKLEVMNFQNAYPANKKKSKPDNQKTRIFNYAGEINRFFENYPKKKIDLDNLKQKFEESIGYVMDFVKQEENALQDYSNYKISIKKQESIKPDLFNQSSSYDHSLIESSSFESSFTKTFTELDNEINLALADYSDYQKKVIQERRDKNFKKLF